MLRKSISFFVLLALIGCSAVSVSTDYDPATDFNTYKTYKWGTANDPNDALLKNQLVLNRVYKAIDNSLTAKGFTKTDNNPDFVVYPHAGTKERTNIESWGYGYGGWWGAGPYMGWPGGNIDVNQYTEGSLFIDIVDMTDNKLIWRGVGTGVVDAPSSPEEGSQKMNDAVAKILQDFPPHTGSSK
ncbi:MAG: DUF4136 domain-containing protein [Ignavibacteriaceae bacterium]|nr:DUF4136 domain-containing protein [Ignavibacteriaceae bacterium]